MFSQPFKLEKNISDILRVTSMNQKNNLVSTGKLKLVAGLLSLISQLSPIDTKAHINDTTNVPLGGNVSSVRWNCFS